MEPVLQLALDFVDISRAMRVAKEAVQGGVDWLEAGTPLIKSEGLAAVRALRKEFPWATIVADMKTMDAGRAEVEAAAKAGADIVDVLGAASDATIRECVEAARNYGCRIVMDLINVADPVARSRFAEEVGVDIITVHCPIDDQMVGKDPFDALRRVVAAVRIPVAVAGGIHPGNAAAAVAAGASIVIVGGAIAKSADARAAAEAVKRAMREGISIDTGLYRRVGEEELAETFAKVSTANISDAMHHAGDLPGIRPIATGLKMVGRALTVRTYPGDWAKAVEAIDRAGPGDVIVIDAGGVPPAVWGELATHSCFTKKVAGVVIDGAIRDTAEVRRLGFPAFARHVTPTAGEPKGFGEIGVPVKIAGVRVLPGDWIVGDDDGVVVVPKAKAVEICNRAMDVLEKENRVRAEIDRGSTFARVAEIEKWEKTG